MTVGDYITSHINFIYVISFLSNKLELSVPHKHPVKYLFQNTGGHRFNTSCSLPTPKYCMSLVEVHDGIQLTAGLTAADGNAIRLTNPSLPHQMITQEASEVARATLAARRGRLQRRLGRYLRRDCSAE